MFVRSLKFLIIFDYVSACICKRLYISTGKIWIGNYYVYPCVYCYFHNVSADMSSVSHNRVLQTSNNTGILNSCTRSWLTESEQVTPVVSIKDVVRSSVKITEFDKHLKKTGEHIGRNVVEITIKMKTIVRKTVMIKINKLSLKNLDI